VALIQGSWVTKCWSLIALGMHCRLSARTRPQLRKGSSPTHPMIAIFIKNCTNPQPSKSFKRPSVTGRVFFRLFVMGQATPIQNQQFLDATL
jgi:hypothetical protein